MLTMLLLRPNDSVLLSIKVSDYVTVCTCVCVSLCGLVYSLVCVSVQGWGWERRGMVSMKPIGADKNGGGRGDSLASG